MGLLDSVIGLATEAASSYTADTSNWGSIHPDLIAHFVQIDADGTPTGTAFKALVKDGSIDQTFEWNAPFENMTAEQKSPNFMAAVQSGAGKEVLNALGKTAENAGAGGVSDGLKGLSDWVSKGQGKSGITKLNSRQVYAGHAPLEINMTLIFRAWSDPQSEVAQPFAALQKMAYPAQIAMNALEEANNGSDRDGIGGFLSAGIFPSDAPKFVALYYKGECYKPMIIESIGKPLDAPYSVMGDIFLEVPVKLESYQSLDYADIQNIRSGSLGGLTGKIAENAFTAVSKLFK